MDGGWGGVGDGGVRESEKKWGKKTRTGDTNSSRGD